MFREAGLRAVFPELLAVIIDQRPEATSINAARTLIRIRWVWSGIRLPRLEPKILSWWLDSPEPIPAYPNNKEYA